MVKMTVGVYHPLDQSAARLDFFKNQIMVASGIYENRFFRPFICHEVAEDRHRSYKNLIYYHRITAGFMDGL